MVSTCMQAASTQAARAVPRAILPPRRGFHTRGFHTRAILPPRRGFHTRGAVRSRRGAVRLPRAARRLPKKEM